MKKLAIALVLVVGCIPRGEERATNAAIGGLMAYDLAQCIDKAGSWTAYDACEAKIRKCATEAKTVGDYTDCATKE